jgi:hypothetical protein
MPVERIHIAHFMKVNPPRIIQGGKGASIWTGASHERFWHWDNSVKTLQDGHPGGHIRRAFGHFPFPRMASRVLDRPFIADRRPSDLSCRRPGMQDLKVRVEPL